MGVIPKMMTKLLGNGDLDGTVTTPGRGGSDGQDPRGGTGASGGLPEKFEQRGPSFEFGEMELAGVTGITQKKLAQKRVKKLREGEDWSLTPGDKGGLRVAYSSAGLVAILAAVTGKVPSNGEIAGIRLSELENKTRVIAPVPQKEAAATTTATRPNVRTAKVRRFFPNPYIIECELAKSTSNGEGPLELVIVRVKSAKNFRKGMEVPLRWDEQGKRYELARRLPRFSGRW